MSAVFFGDCISVGENDTLIYAMARSATKLETLIYVMARPTTKLHRLIYEIVKSSTEFGFSETPTSAGLGVDVLISHTLLVHITVVFV